MKREGRAGHDDSRAIMDAELSEPHQLVSLLSRPLVQKPLAGSDPEFCLLRPSPTGTSSAVRSEAPRRSVHGEKEAWSSETKGGDCWGQASIPAIRVLCGKQPFGRPE